MNLKSLPYTEYQQRYKAGPLEDRLREGMLGNAPASFPDPAGYFDTSWSPKASRGTQKFEDTAFEAMIAEQDQELDAEARKGLIWELQRYVAGESHGIPVLTQATGLVSQPCARTSTARPATATASRPSPASGSTRPSSQSLGLHPRDGASGAVPFPVPQSGDAYRHFGIVNDDALRPPRPGWPEAPTALRAAIEHWLGAPVISAISQPGGFSPGIAVRLLAANGRRAFVKAVAPGPNVVAPAMHRRERLIVSALPAEAPIPRLLLSYDEGDEGWIALVFSDIEGANPATPWYSADLRRVLHAMTRLAEALTPSPLAVDLATPVSTWNVLTGRYWESLAASSDARAGDWPLRHAGVLAEVERSAAEAATGDSLVHLDVRSDNLILSGDDVWFVDWAHARIGAPWVDLLFFAPSVEMEGGPRPEGLIEGHPLLRGVDPAAVDAVVSAIAGFFTWQGLQPPPPGLPTVRAFQGEQGVVARRWLARRLGLPAPG